MISVIVETTKNQNFRYNCLYSILLWTGDYLTYETKFTQSGKGNPLCKICKTENESICHIIAICSSLSEIRSRILQEISELCLHTKTEINLKNISENPETLTQFLLDQSSFNLENRIHISDPVLNNFYHLSRDLRFSLHSARMRKLTNLQDLHTVVT